MKWKDGIWTKLHRDEDEPFSVFIVRYKDGDNENSLCLEPKNFFGFLIS